MWCNSSKYNQISLSLTCSTRMYLNKITKSRIVTFLLKTMSTFTQTRNSLNGTNEWILQKEDYDYHQEVARAAFADMLHDTERNQMYEAGLKVAIDHMHSLGKKANVLDIGTGTGLLSMMAARNGADTIYACEAFNPMSRCALDIIKLNNYSDKINIIPKRSTDLKINEDMPQRANILVTEVFDTELIGEGAISTFKHAHAHLLDSDCVVVPNRATIYAQVVESPIAQAWNKVRDIYNLDGELLFKVPDIVKECRGSAELHDIQLSQLPFNKVNVLTKPVPVLKFDWSGKSDFKFNSTSVTELKSQHTGSAQAIFMWWDLNMDLNNEVILSCAPYWAHYKYNPQKMDAFPWRDHWMQAVYYLPKEINLKRDDTFRLVSAHDEYSLWFNLIAKKYDNDDELPSTVFDPPRCDCNLHLAFSRTRIGQLNDGTRQKKILSLLENKIDADSIVLAIGDCFYLSLAAIKYGAKKLYILDTNTITRRILSSFLIKNKDLLTKVTIIEDVKDLHEMTEKINVVLSEPYFVSSILPWDNLMFLYKLEEFRMFLSDDVKIFPQECVVKAIAVQFQHLHKIRAPLETCEGFKMAPFDKLIDYSSDISDDNVEAQPLWEYPCIALCSAVELCRIDLTQTSFPKVETTQSFTLLNDKVCNGVAIWTDWCLDGSSKNIITTGPIIPIESGKKITWDMHTRQGVSLMGSKQVKNEVHTMFTFDYHKAHINFKVLEK